jgi:hypothetical protein
VILGDPAVHVQVGAADRPLAEGKPPIDLHEARLDAGQAQIALTSSSAALPSAVSDLIGNLAQLQAALDQARSEVDRIRLQIQQLAAQPGSLDPAAEAELAKSLEKHAVEIERLFQDVIGLKGQSSGIAPTNEMI